MGPMLFAVGRGAEIIFAGISMGEESEQFKTYRTDWPVCPYCGYDEPDPWEIETNETSIDCVNCGKKYAIEQIISRTFCSFKTCQPKQPHDFGEWKDLIGYEVRYCRVCSLREIRRVGA